MKSYEKLLVADLPKRIGKDILKEFNDPDKNASSRWLWELMQNAKDCNDGIGLDITVQLSLDSISFSHNGKGFTQKDLVGLLTADSSKTPNYSDSDKYHFYRRAINNSNLTDQEINEYLTKTGKFGTGFMTTYLLSKEVSISSYYLDNEGNAYYIDVNLDRNADNPVDMEAKVNESFKVFDKIDSFSETDRIVDTDKDSLTTKFTYRLEDISSKKTAEKGIDNFTENIALTMAFVDEISSVTLIRDGVSKSYVKVVDSIDDYLSIVTIGDVSILMCRSVNSIIRTAVPISIVNGSNCSISEFSDLTSTQFISFPLIKDEVFAYPIAVHCPLFNPTVSRDSVIIESDDDLQGSVSKEKAKLNKLIYDDSLSCYVKILNYAINNNFSRIYLLAKTNTPTTVDKDWFKILQTNMREQILDNAKVISSIGEIRSIRNCKFPISVKKASYNDFWEICRQFFPDTTPDLNHSKQWSSVIHPSVEEYTKWNSSIKCDIDDILLLFDEVIDFQGLSLKYFSTNSLMAFSAIRNIANYIASSELDYFERDDSPIKILPNYNNKLEVKEKLYRNANIPEKVINASALINSDLDYNKIFIIDELGDLLDSTKTKSLVKLGNSIKVYLEKRENSELNTVDNKNLLLGLLNLASFVKSEKREQQTKLWKILKQVYGELISSENLNLVELDNYNDFDNTIILDVLINSILFNFNNIQNLDGFSTMNEVSLFLFKRDYVEKDDFDVDSFLNILIEYVQVYNNSELYKYSIIPDQNNKLHNAGGDIHLDVRLKERDENSKIDKELKCILAGFSKDSDLRYKLVHLGVSYRPSSKLDTSDICKLLDECVIKARDSQDEEIKQNIRNLDNWISKTINVTNNLIEENRNTIITDDNLKEWFGRFYQTRAGIAYNTLSLDEKKKSSRIIHSGHLNEFSQIASILESNEEIDKRTLVKNMMDSLKKENDKIIQTKFYKGLGESIETVFSGLLGGKAIKLDLGQDFILLNEFLEVGIRLEIKSRSKYGEFVYMTRKQVDTAVNFQGLYILCIYPDVSDSTVSGFKSKSKFIMNISSIVRDKYLSTQSFIKSNVDNINKELVEVEFENKSYKYKIDKKVWLSDKESVLSYSYFSDFIKNKYA